MGQEGDLVKKILVIILLSSIGIADASIRLSDSNEKQYLNQIEDKILTQIAKQFRGAKIKCAESCTARIQNSFLKNQKIKLSSIRFDHDAGDGRAYLDAVWIDKYGKERNMKFGVPFHAWKTVPIAKQKISPRETLEHSQFRFEEIDIAKGLGRQYRNLILSSDSKFNELEAKNTILAGHFPLLNGVQRIPLVRRGDLIKIILKSSGLKLLTSGTALKEAYAGQKISVLTRKNKRKFSGILRKDGSVEVKL